MRHQDSTDDKAMENYPQPEWFDYKLELEVTDKKTGLPSGKTRARSAREVMRMIRAPRDKSSNRKRRVFYNVMVTPSGVTLSIHGDSDRKKLAEGWITNAPGELFFTLLQAGYFPVSIKTFLYKNFQDGRMALCIDHSFWNDNRESEGPWKSTRNIFFTSTTSFQLCATYLCACHHAMIVLFTCI